jgi:hypothetical protein
MMLNGLPQVLPQTVNGVATPVMPGLLDAAATVTTNKEDMLKAFINHPLFQGLLAQQQYQNYGPGALAATWNGIQGGADSGEAP